MFILLFVVIGIIAVAATIVIPTLFIQHAQKEGVNIALMDAVVVLICCILPLTVWAGIQFFLFIIRSMGCWYNMDQPPESDSPFHTLVQASDSSGS